MIKNIVRIMIPERWRPSNILAKYISNVQARGTIIAGPFKGMLYQRESICGANSPKWIGTYELELSGVFNRLRHDAFECVIDVGAAEGYYAVGAALMWPSAQIIAFEMEDRGHELIWEMAVLNHVENRVEIRGTCEVGDLLEVLPSGKRTLLIMDTEGCEQTLLADSVMSALENTDVIVEIHDFVNRTMGEQIKQRLNASHVVTEILSRPRRISDFTWPATYLGRLYLLHPLKGAAWEYRPEPMRWFHARPRHLS